MAMDSIPWGLRVVGESSQLDARSQRGGLDDAWCAAVGLCLGGVESSTKARVYEELLMGGGVVGEENWCWRGCVKGGKGLVGFGWCEQISFGEGLQMEGCMVRGLDCHVSSSFGTLFSPHWKSRVFLMRSQEEEGWGVAYKI